jgi:hypothetical protein
MRLTLVVLAGLLAVGLTIATIERLRGRRGSPAALLVSVAVQWLAAWVLWSFAGGLALRAGLLGAYDGSLFPLVAVAGGVWQYRAAVARGREHGLVVFVGAQLAWLAVVLLRNGLLRGVW